MKSMKTYGAAMLLTALAAVASAQVSKSLPGTMEIVTVTVESIEKASREVTVKKPDGSYGVFSVSEDVKRFDTLKVGDKITAKYYENIVLRLKAPGEKDIDSENAAITQVGQRRCRDGRRAAGDHRDDHQDRHEGAVDRLQRAERLELQHARRRQEGAGEGQGRRQSGHHVDAGRDRRARRAEVTTPGKGHQIWPRETTFHAQRCRFRITHAPA